jgi:uncharacterized membrane protein
MSPNKYLYTTVSIGVFYLILFFVSLTSDIYFGSNSIFSYYLDGIMGFLVFLMPVIFLTLFFVGVFQFKKNTEKKSLTCYAIIASLIFFVLSLWLLWGVIPDYGGEWSQPVQLHSI